MEFKESNVVNTLNNNEKFNTFKDKFFDEKTAFAISYFLRNNITVEKQQIIDSLRDETVVDLGAGESKGGLEFAYLSGAFTYVAVDVESSFTGFPKPEQVSMNVDLRHTDMLSYLKTISRNEENPTIYNFIISGVDKNIITDEKYVMDVVSEIKKSLDSRSTILVICPEVVTVTGKEVNLNVFGDELQRQGFKVLLNVDPYTNFWTLRDINK